MSDHETDAAIRSTLTNYVAARNSLVTRYHAVDSGLLPSNASQGGPIAFNTLVNDFARQLTHLMPLAMSAEQWEALAQLALSHAADIRMRDTK